MLLVSGDADLGAQWLCEHLARLDGTPEYVHIPGSKVWLKEDDDVNQAVVPEAVVRAIASWLAGPHA